MAHLSPGGSAPRTCRQERSSDGLRGRPWSGGTGGSTGRGMTRTKTVASFAARLKDTVDLDSVRRGLAGEPPEPDACRCGSGLGDR